MVKVRRFESVARRMMAYRKIPQNTDRTMSPQITGLPALRPVRSVLTAIITRADGFIARSLQIATADLTYGVGALAGLSYTSMVARSVRSVP
jgi:hypothetical protein